MNRNIEHESLHSLLTRRDFVRMAGGCAGLSGLSVLSTLLDLRLTSSLMAAQPSEDYKAIVCVFLFGGNDSYNLLVPYDNDPYNGYVQIRRGLHNPDPNSTDVGVALPRESDIEDPGDPLLGMSLKPLLGKQYGIHGYFNDIKGYDADGNYGPKASGYMQQLYQAGELAFVANVGSTERPVDKSNWSNNRPVGLFSHSDEQRNWMTSRPQSRAESIGWAGRIADLLTDPTGSYDYNPDASIGMGIALNNNTWNTGARTLPYIVSTGGASKLAGYGGVSSKDKILTMSTDMLLTEQYANLLELTHSRSRREAVDAAIAYTDATNNAALMTDWPFDNQPPGPGERRNNLADQLNQVARAIVARGPDGLNQQRQIFFVFRGGFDNHKNLISNHSGSMPEVSEALYHFTEELRAQGLLDCVTTFTMSDFGRTQVPNDNSGTDHAWASNQLAIGGTQLNGGQVHGTYPDMSNPADFNTNGGQYTTDRRGRMIPGASVDEYVKELVQWFGVSETDLPLILPNIGNFPDSLGLMS